MVIVEASTGCLTEQAPRWWLVTSSEERRDLILVTVVSNGARSGCSTRRAEGWRRWSPGNEFMLARLISGSPQRRRLGCLRAQIIVRFARRDRDR